MGLELYLDLLSQPCRSVYLFAKKNNIPFELKPTLLLKGQHRDAAFRAVNQLMKVPALKDGDFTLTERHWWRAVAAGSGERHHSVPTSIAILLYLARKFQTPDHWYPADLQKRARVDEYLSWQEVGIGVFASKVCLIKKILPLFLGCPVPLDKLQGAIDDLNEALKTFEEKFLQDRPFIVGDEISLADLVAFVELMQPIGADHDIFQGVPKLAAWRQRVEDTMGKDLLLEAHKPLLHLENVDLDHLPPAVKEHLIQTLLKFLQ